MEAIAGYELAFGADIMIDGQPADFAGDGHTAELVVHIGAQKEVFQPVEYDGSTAKFYLSPEHTAELKERKHDGQLALTVRFFIGGDPDRKEAPVHRLPLTLKEE